MKKIHFSHSIMAVVLSSVLASGAVLAQDTRADKSAMPEDKAPMMSDQAHDKAHRTGDKARDAANKAESYVDDSVVTTKVKAELLKADHIKSNDISVETNDGIVTLTGFVASQDQVKEAIAVTEKVDGVKSVSDKLNVKDKDESTLKEYADDAMITSAVKAKFLTADGVPSMGISVETNDGVVQLTGNVDTKEEAARAEQVAKDVDDVKSVKNDLVVK
ncbi:MAG: molecular chaperone OsmY [Aeromonadales bacterium]|nr:molecular chaperone OsmY [Aeromonadales bacterium]